MWFFEIDITNLLDRKYQNRYGVGIIEIWYTFLRKRDEALLCRQKLIEKEKKTKEGFGNIDGLGSVRGVGCFELFTLNLKAISYEISMALELF